MSSYKNTLRYQNRVAALKSRPTHIKEAALLQAIAGGSQWRMDAAIEAIGTKNEWRLWGQSGIYGPAGTRVLELAATLGRLETVQQICALNGCEVTDKSQDFPNSFQVNRAFEYAVAHGHYNVARYLRNACKAGPDYDMHYACPRAMEAAFAEIDFYKIDFLLSCGANPTKALFEAVFDADKKVVEHLVIKGADINCAKEGFWTPFYVAVKYQRDDIAYFLLASGANANTQCASETMGWAVRHDNVEMVKTLIRLNVMPDESDLSTAQKRGFKAIEQLIAPLVLQAKTTAKPPSP